MKKATLLIGMQLLLILGYAQQKKINIVTELDKLHDIKDLPSYSQATVGQFSSYDRTGGNDDGFSGKYSYIKRNVDSTLVLFEAKGNGVINRIWTPTPTNDTLDFYFGNSEKANFSISFQDLFSGKVYPFVNPLCGNEIGGYYSYVPIPYAKGCKIILRGKKLQFYQIQYNTYPNNMQVENFRLPFDEQAKNALKQVEAKWKQVKTELTQSIKHITIDTLLSPGETVKLVDFQQGGRIIGFELSPSDAFEGLNKQIDLLATWDNETMPAINAPVADFFGYAFGKTSMQSLLLGSSNGVNYCYFPMPFDRRAEIALRYRTSNLSTKPVRVKAEIYVNHEKRKPRTEGKFYAFWHDNQHAALGKPHVFLEGKGKGHYVGTLLQAQGLDPGMTLFFEGDDVTEIDGEMRLHGTGSEDYFNGGWYALLDRWDRKMSLPLHGSLDYSLPYARTGGYRLFLTDKMPFTKEILHTIEHGPERNNKPVNYTSLALYYADAAIAKQTQEPSNLVTSVYLPDTMMVYPQLMRYSIGGQVKINGNEWQFTNGGQLKVDLSTLPRGRYKLFADLERIPEGAEFTIWQRQKQVSDTLSAHASVAKKEAFHYLCNIDLDDFKDAITFHVGDSSVKNVLKIERLILVRND
ncbi:glycoside hydrolase family 172 protein [Olivibacter domesticus]|uniref:DUF2961 domain-containing protein n=1 Tax=Olivibacter domesticus TaxID=407022 RepID=A0A1H7LX80_OLID1|nr:glycoside hydrolase family 172 protein [Olivibacter domesticus]SEL02917.1 Protein of unknown function [Olivibacter domesticus]